MISFQHQAHLSGHLLSAALRESYPGLELYRSQDIAGGLFWVDILAGISPDELTKDALAHVREKMIDIRNQARVFRHLNLSPSDILSIFPGQERKYQESILYGKKFSGNIPAYELDGHVELCSCNQKDASLLREVDCGAIDSLTLERLQKGVLRVTSRYQGATFDCDENEPPFCSV